MNKSELFKKAHKLTKQVIRQGDSYNVTFGLCLKQVIENEKKQKIDTFFFVSINLVFCTCIILAILMHSKTTAFIGVLLSIFLLVVYMVKTGIINFKELFNSEFIIILSSFTFIGFMFVWFKAVTMG